MSNKVFIAKVRSFFEQTSYEITSKMILLYLDKCTCTNKNGRDKRIL